MEKLKNNKATSFVILGLLSAMIMIMTFIFGSGEGDMQRTLLVSYFNDPLLLAMNLIPIIAVFLLIYALSGRLYLGFFATAALFFAIGVVQKFKLIYRDEPFMIPEIALFRESVMMKGNYNISIFTSNPPAVISLVAILAITFALFKLYPRPWRGKIRRRTFLATLALSAVLFRGFTGPYFNPVLYEKVGNDDIINIFNDGEKYQSKGLVYPFLYTGRMLLGNRPEDYDKKLAEMLWEEYRDPVIPEDKKVHVVSVMLESFADFSIYEGAPIYKDVYKNLHRIQRESLHGRLVADIFGGGTVNTERGFLTGYSGANHSGSVNYLKDVNSHVRYMKNNGYITEALHPIKGWFYNRSSINPRLGFDDYLCYENYFKPIEEQYDIDKGHGYTRDNHFLPEVEKRLDEAAKNGNYYFSYALTYQGHGPYAEYGRGDRDYLKPLNGERDKNWCIVNHYLSDIYATDKALGAFVDSLRKHPEPVVLVFFGDHKPWLGEEESGYHAMGINVDQSTLEGTLNYYTTPYVIWANPAAKAKLGKDFKGEGPDMSPFLLMNYLYTAMGWPKDAMMQMQDHYLKGVTVYHDPLVRKDGAYINVSDDKTLQENIRNYRSMEYYRAAERIKDNN